MTSESRGAAGRRVLGDLRSDLVRYLPSQAVPAILGFVSIPIITSLFPPADYGDYRLALATVGSFSAVSVWMATAIYRFFPESELDGRLADFKTTIFRGLIATNTVLSLVWLGGLVILGARLSPQLRLLMVVGLVVMNVNTMWSLAAALVRVQRRVGWYSAGVVFNRSVALAVGVGLVLWWGFGVEGLLYGSVVASVTALPVLLKVGLRRLPSAGGRFSRRLLVDMVKFAGPVVLGQLAAWFLSLSDRYVIAWARGSVEVGLYTAAYGIAEQSVAIILTVFQLPFAVLGARVWERDGAEVAARFVTNSARGYLLVAIPAWFGISVLAQPVMRLMTAPAYHSAAGVMPYVAGALVLWGVQYWFSAAAMFLKKTSRYAGAVLVGVVVNIGLNLWLVPLYGYRAAAVTTLAAYAISVVVMAILTRADFRWEFPWRSVVRAVIAASVMAGAIALFRATTSLSPALTVAVAVPGGAVVYTAILAVFGELPEDVRRWTRDRVGRVRS